MREASLPMESGPPPHHHHHHVPGVSSSLLGQRLLDGRVPYGRLQPPLTTIFPIDQMKSSHAENDYIDSPAVVVSQQPPSQKVALSSREPSLPLHPHPHHEALLSAHQHHHDATTHPWISFSGRPSSVSSSSSTSSEQRLLDHAAPTPTLDHPPQPTAATINTRTPQGCFDPPKVLTSSSTSSSSKAPDLKALAAAGLSPALPATAGAVVPSSPAEKRHLLRCAGCGKCRCSECTVPRALPSCWVCNQECLCSVPGLVDAATCMCLVRGVFYHCAEDEDEEGSCADRPCSCAPASHRCARWSFMAALSLVLPCLVCYLPAMGVAKLSQRCYDSARRPGCRCKPAAVVEGVGPQQDGAKVAEAGSEKQQRQAS